jgi:hypothetical protein
MVLSSIFAKGVIQKGGSADIATLIVKNSGFLAKIFTNLLVQLAITYYVMENYPVPENKWLYFFGSIWFIAGYCMDKFALLG